MKVIRIPAAEDVETPEDLILFFRAAFRANKALAGEALSLAPMIRVMLRRDDHVSGKNNRARVSRAVFEMAGSNGAAMVLSGLAARRMRTGYPHLFGVSRQSRSRSGREWHRRRAA